MSLFLGLNYSIMIAYNRCEEYQSAMKLAQRRKANGFYSLN